MGFGGQEEALLHAQPLPGQEDLGESLVHPFAEQPWGRATAGAAAWLIRVLSVSANDRQILNGLASMLHCSGAGELQGLSPHPPFQLQRSQLACSQPKGEMLLCGCGFVPGWPET